MTMLDLEPKEVWRYFSEVCSVPRGSGFTDGIRDYLVQFASNNNLYCKVDEVGNVIIRKPATDGCTLSSLLFQGHMDMVCEKNSNIEHNFHTDSLEVIVDEKNGTVKANGTTLGGDDGIGVAIAMALLTDKSIDRPVEALFTVDEEVGLTGALMIKPGLLESKTLINLDSEDDNEIIIGCSGGVDTSIWIDIERERPDFRAFAAKVKVSGLKGGHSGEDIDKRRANSNKLLAEFLRRIQKVMDLRIVSIDGGGLRNAIPREAAAVIMVPWADKETLRVIWNMYEAECEDEWKADEPGMKFELDSVSVPEECYTKELTQKIITVLTDTPHGVIEFNHTLNMVEVSTNLAFIREKDGKLLVGTSQRSPNAIKRDTIATRVGAVGRGIGAKIEHIGAYCGWEPKKNSPLQKSAVEVYERLFGNKPTVKTIHAGLECGLFLDKYPDLDMISIGPKILDIHSPNETLYISTVEKCWKFVRELCNVLP